MAKRGKKFNKFCGLPLRYIVIPIAYNRCKHLIDFGTTATTTKICRNFVTFALYEAKSIVK